MSPQGDQGKNIGMYLSVGMNNNKAQKYSNQSHENVWLLQINAIGFKKQNILIGGLLKGVILYQP